VCLGIALVGSEVPTELTGRLGSRLHMRSDRPEYRFLYRDRYPRLPVIRDGQLVFVRWGNGRGRSRGLPRSGWTWMESIEGGIWRNLEPVDVSIPATYGLDGRGVWYRIEVGIRGLLVPDENGKAIVYMICEPASDYYHVMTGSKRMPVLIDQRI
jgi:hypothetical protein